MRRIASRQNPIVSRYRLARGDTGDLILLDGPHLVADAIAAGVRVTEAAVTTDASESLEIRRLTDRLVRAGVELTSVTASVMAALSPVRSSSLIVALAHAPAGGAIFGDDRTTPLVVAAMGVQDPGNLGAIVRVAEAAGATGVLVGEGSAHPYGWKALRGSMGSALRTPIAVIKDDSSVGELRRHHCRIVAAAPRGGRSLFDLEAIDLGGPLAILVGSEGAGLAPALLEQVDVLVSIPMEPPVESLNTAVSAALLLYEARRQRARLAEGVGR
jgi:TrmH family RNA methyltransferase